MDYLKAEFLNLLDNMKSDDIKRLFILLSRFDAEVRLATLQTEMRSYVKQQGHVAIEASKKESLKDATGRVYVDTILAVSKKKKERKKEEEEKKKRKRKNRRTKRENNYILLTSLP